MLKNLNVKVLLAGGVIALTSIISSCKKDIVKAPEANTVPSKLKAQSSGDNLYDLLGFGYDVTGLYANANSSTYKVIDVDKLVKNSPDSFTSGTNVSQTTEYNIGINASDYSHFMSSKYTGTATFIADVFGATVNQSFHETTSISSKYIYASASIVIQQKRLKFNAATTLLRDNYLSAVFISDVSSMTAQQLVTKYGTHILMDIILGAKLDMFYKAQTTSTNRGEAAQSGLVANGFKVFNVSSDVTTKDTSTASDFNQTLYYNTVGGDGTKGLIGELSLDNSAPKIEIGNWQSTCTRDNAAFIQFGSKDALVPLSEFIADPTKKAAVKSYTDQYIASHQIVLTPNFVGEYYSSKEGRHAYSMENLNASFPAYTFNGNAFKAFYSPYLGGVAVYQFYNKSNNDRVLTTNRFPGISGYNYDGIITYALKTQISGTIPIHEFFNTRSADHLYSTNRNAVSPASGWAYNGVAFYAYTNQN